MAAPICIDLFFSFLIISPLFHFLCSVLSFSLSFLFSFFLFSSFFFLFLFSFNPVFPFFPFLQLFLSWFTFLTSPVRLSIIIIHTVKAIGIHKIPRLFIISNTIKYMWKFWLCIPKVWPSSYRRNRFFDIYHTLKCMPKTFHQHAHRIPNGWPPSFTHISFFFGKKIHLKIWLQHVLQVSNEVTGTMNCIDIKMISKSCKK